MGSIGLSASREKNLWSFDELWAGNQSFQNATEYAWALGRVRERQRKHAPGSR